MEWIVDEHGMAEGRIHTGAELDALSQSGRPWWGTLTGAILHGKVEATAFHRPFEAEAYFDGRQVLENHMSVTGLNPVGKRPNVRVECFEGALQHPPLWMEEARRRGFASMARKTGSRPWHVAMLDNEDLTVFFHEDSRHRLEASVDAAIRKLYPDRNNHQDALENDSGLCVCFGRAMGPAKSLQAAMIQLPDPAAEPVFILANDASELNEAITSALTSDMDSEMPGLRSGATGGGIFLLAEAAGVRIEVGCTWLTDQLVQQVAQSRAEQAEPDMQP